MRLLSRGRDEAADRKVQNTRQMIDDALEKMQQVLDRVEEQAERTKEEISDREPGE